MAIVWLVCVMEEGLYKKTLRVGEHELKLGLSFNGVDGVQYAFLLGYGPSEAVAVPVQVPCCALLVSYASVRRDLLSLKWFRLEHL